MGCDGRDLPVEGSCEMSVHDDGGELVLQLAAGFYHPLPGGRAVRQPWLQRLLDLGRLLLDCGKQYQYQPREMLGSEVADLFSPQVFFVYFMIYETKDMTLEQVNELYETVRFAPKSVGYHAAARRFSSVAADGSQLPPPGKDSQEDSEKSEIVKKVE